MQLVVLLISAAFLYATFQLCLSKIAGRVDDFLANAIFNAVAMVLPLAIFGWFAARKHVVPIDKPALGWCVAAGLVLAVFSILLVKIFSRGGNLGYVLPVVYGGAIIIGTILGYVFLKQSVSLLQFIGLSVTALGIAIVVFSKVN